MGEIEYQRGVSTQFKLRIPADLVLALTNAAKNHNRRSAQEVAEDVLRIYLPFWEQAEQVKQNKVEEQRERLFGGGTEADAGDTIRAVGHLTVGKKGGGKTKTGPKRVRQSG